MKSYSIFIFLIITFCLSQGCKEHEDKVGEILELKTKLSVIQFKQDTYLIREKIRKRDNLYSKRSVFLLRNKFDFFMESYSKETDNLLTFLDSVKLQLLNQENLDSKTFFTEIGDSVLVKLNNHKKTTIFMLESENKYNGKAIQTRINAFISTFKSDSCDVFIPELFFEPIIFENIYTEDGGMFTWEYSFDHLPLIECLRTLQTVKQKIIDLNIQAFSLENWLKESYLINREVKPQEPMETKE